MNAQMDSGTTPQATSKKNHMFQVNATQMQKYAVLKALIHIMYKLWRNI